MSTMTKEMSAVEIRLFPESAWEDIFGPVSQAFRMTEDEKSRFYDNRIARLIAAIPFLAGCEDAGRTACVHLGAYFLSIREPKAFFNARADESGTVFDRLRLLADFKGGDARVIDKGLSLLALNMVCDYQRDVEEDAKLGKYNPVGAGDWDYKTIVADLEYRILTVDCPEMDAIASIHVMPMCWWST